MNRFLKQTTYFGSILRPFEVETPHPSPQRHRPTKPQHDTPDHHVVLTQPLKAVLDPQGKLRIADEHLRC